ncbi:PREDICTED: tyrosine-protein phosphatase non-receptor type 2 [Nanorana parkeri]|uniref:tyrosine-protein phosphatase non-receptor type 2 n=1 Tax=Nanorana parkeri TaxID=125878 RepID=UPI0008541A82|nr:PREDICTED: tyrosine-protein phosphatase non-receptor type 2 [Nanorana parkeri]
MENEFKSIDEDNRWTPLYGEIRLQSPVLSNKIAKNPENKNRNRYRDVNPYDHSRVKLQNVENDYINASLVVVEEAQRNYILTQGPLPNTCCHFWLMVWQQKSKAIVMLNRVIEKDVVKCAQYWPTPEDEVLPFRETGLCVKLLSEDIKANYTVRVLQLQNINTAECREIFHFHYTTWPDFGVPESPASFLNFLIEVRNSGSLDPDYGPSVVHCSAGIGRSGTFSLVDTCLILIEKRKDPSTVEIKQVLLNMRSYRMGLIQTPGQLRFSYMAVIEGTKLIMEGSSQQCKDISKDDQSDKVDSKQTDERYNGNRLHTEEQNDVKSQETESDAQSTLRKRMRDRNIRISNTEQKVQQVKQRMSEAEQKRKRWLFWKPFLIPIGLASVLVMGAFVCWKTYSP